MHGYQIGTGEQQLLDEYLAHEAGAAGHEDDLAAVEVLHGRPSGRKLSVHSDSCVVVELDYVRIGSELDNCNLLSVLGFSLYLCVFIMWLAINVLENKSRLNNFSFIHLLTILNDTTIN